MILGIGVDIVDIARFERQLERTPALLPRLFAEAERRLPVPSLAVRFAAKEALIKALGGSGGLGWHDIEIARGGDRAPSFVRTPQLEREFAACGAARAHLSLSHDSGDAVAFVVLEGGTAGEGV
ncbi:MAG: holo-ACP synthase [Leucobacter sp.]|nr:holo-ACP synthase [Leucobacter sp.]